MILYQELLHFCLEEGYSPLTKIFRSATGEQGLTAVRSRSRENNIQLFSYTLAPLRYALYGSMQHTDKVGILPGEQMNLTLVQSGTITANYTASGNTPFCDSESHRGALESSREEGYAARGEVCKNRSASV